MMVKTTVENALDDKLEKEILRLIASQNVQVCLDNERLLWRDRYSALDNDIRQLDSVISRLEGLVSEADAVIVAQEGIYGRRGPFLDQESLSSIGTSSAH
jgi:hypothetical protein